MGPPEIPARFKHTETLTSLNNLALIYRRLGHLDKAEVTHREEWGIARRVLGEDHHDVLVSALNLARVLLDLKRFQETELLLSDAINKAEETLSTNHPLLASMLIAYGDYYIAVHIPKKAEAEFLRARSIWLTMVEPTHERIKRLDAILAEINRAQWQ